MRKVLFCMPNLCGGGAEKVLIDILNNIDCTKFDVTLFLRQERGIYLNSINNKIKIKYLFKNTHNKYISYIMWNVLDMISKMLPSINYKLFIKEKYDVEVAFMEGWATKFVSYTSNNKSKKIAWVHSDLFNNHWTKRFFRTGEESKCYYGFDQINFVSKDAQIAFDNLFKENNSKKQVIYNPIVTEEIIRKSEEFQVNFDIFTVVSVGRLAEQKGYDRLIRAHANLVNQYPHKLVILGEGEERANLEKLISSLGVEASVDLKGFVSNPYPYLKASDLFICSSRSEGYSLVVGEAIILGKAILSTDVSGPKEIIDNGQYGIICENSQVGIEKALQSILSDTEKLLHYREQANIRRTHFNYKEIIKEIEKILI